MDVNGLRSFGLSYGAGLVAWGVPGETGDGSIDHAVEPAPAHTVTGVRLASRASRLPLREDAVAIADVLLGPSMVVDALGNHVRWDGSALVSVSHLAGSEGLVPRRFELPALALPLTDLALGDDDVLYLIGGGAVWLIDLRARFALQAFEAPAGFTPQRIAARPGGGAWLLDVEHGQLARLTGLPLFDTGFIATPLADDNLLACDLNPHPPRLQRVEGAVPADEKAVALAAHPEGGLAVLSLGRAIGGARLRLVIDEQRLSLPLDLAGPRWPHTLGWLGGGRIALATRGHLDGPKGQPRDPGVWVYALPAALRERWIAACTPGATALPAPLSEPLPPQGDFYPLPGWSGGPFVGGRPGTPLHYPRGDGGVLRPAPVARVSLAARARYGVVANAAEGTAADEHVLGAVGLIDTRQAATVWHRLHAEAVLPPGCAVLVWLAASDAGPPAFVPADPTARARWHPHLFGDRGALPAEVQAALPADVPRAVWVRAASEVPLGRSLLCGTREPGRSGLFSVLVQRAGATVRSLQGPRLWVAAELFGNGRETPELVVLRAVAGRQSYRDRYLPALYHETVFGEEADRPGRATGADFLDRTLHLFEGLFTDIEGRIAASALVSDADACPEDALPWLGGWVGMAFEAGMTTARRRRMLRNAATLAQRHGTLTGLRLALDIVADDAVKQGRIVIVEDFRLRRTLATILGADLVDHDDPLTLGLARSGNSIVGEALFLGDRQTLAPGELKTFLALFRNLSADRPGDQDALDADLAAARRALFDDLAHRVTVLVHEDLSGDDLSLVARVAELFTPAHVLVRAVQAQYPFLVGVAALIGADSYLREPAPPRPVRLGPGDEASLLGGIDTLRGEASLDAHAGAFDGVLAQRGDPLLAPVARIDVTVGNPAGQPGTAPLTLDGSASHAASGHLIHRFEWTHQPPR